MSWGDGSRQKIWWRTVQTLHFLDYAVLLPLMSRLPLALGYTLSALRGRLNGLIKRDWRSVGLRTRHVSRQSLAGYRMLFPDASDAMLQKLVRERFETESREEYEGRLIIAERVAQLSCLIQPDEWVQTCLRRERGLLLLTPHFDSFVLGIVFLGMSGVKINAMSSSVTDDQRVDSAVREHFFKKYRGMERMMNGGRVLNVEDNVRSFYQILERGECLVILADAPATDGSAAMTPRFLGSRCKLAGGALRMAQKTGSDLGAFVCRFEGRGRYRVTGGPILNAADPLALDAIYGFLSEEIMASPGRWWAADLWPGIRATADTENPDTQTGCA